MKTNRMIFVALAGITAGVVSMFIYDPNEGRRRRARLFDKMNKSNHSLNRFATRKSRHLQNKVKGALAEFSERRRPGYTTDEVLAARIRSAMGRVVRNPSAIEVKACHGVVELNGAVLSTELPELLSTIKEIRGVRDVCDHLVEYKRAADVHR